MAKKKTNNEPKEEMVNTKKVEKEISKYLEEQKEIIISEINNKIDEQISFKVSKRMKEEEKRYIRNKNKKIIIRDIIIILLLAVIGYFGYCLYKVDYFNIRTKVIEKPIIKNNNEEEPKKPDNKEPVVDVHDTAYYIENFSYLLDNLFIEDESVFDLFKKTTKDSITNELKLKVAYKNLHKDGINIEKNMLTFSSNELLNSAKKIFGETVEINNELFSYNNLKFMFYNETYIGLQEQETEIGLLTKITEAEEKDNKLSFNIIIARLTNENKLVNNKGEIILEEYHDEDITTLKDKLSTFKVTFEKENDNYIFSSINEK